MPVPKPANDMGHPSLRQDIRREIPQAEKRLGDCVRTAYNKQDTLTHQHLARMLGTNPHELLRDLDGEGGMSLPRAVEILAALGQDLFFEVH